MSSPASQAVIERIRRYSSHHYERVPIVVDRARGASVWDLEGREYIDMLSCFSAVIDHNHPRITRVICEWREQGKVDNVSNLYNTPVYADFVESLAGFCGMEKVLPKNGGVEAVESAIKIARKWGYKVKGVPADKAEIILCENNFHGRTITVLSGSTVPQYKDGFGPFTPGFKTIPFGDADALEQAITPNTVAFLVEPIQGEGGINVPPIDYLNRVSWICTQNDVLFILDEIQTGFCRTGKKFAFWSELLSAMPDLLIVGKALGGGALPISAVVGRGDVMDVIGPGDDGSTFGGNPLACAVAVEALKIMEEEHLAERAAELGAYFMNRLKQMNNHFQLIEDVRGRGLLIGVEFRPGIAEKFCDRMLEAGILCHETRNNTVRFAPPLTITKDELDMALGKIKYVLDHF